jgi:hypothetical protein
MSLLLEPETKKETGPSLPPGLPANYKLATNKTKLRNEALSDLSLLLAPTRSFENQMTFLKSRGIKTLVFPTYFFDNVLKSDVDKLRGIMQDLRLWKKRLPPTDELLRTIHERASVLKRSDMFLVSIEQYARAFPDRLQMYRETARTLRNHVNKRFLKFYRMAAEIAIEFLAAAAKFGVQIVSVGERIVKILSRAFPRLMKTVKIIVPGAAAAKLVVGITLIVLRPEVIPNWDPYLVQVATRALDKLAQSLQALSVPFDPSSLGLGQMAAIVVVCP